MSDDELEPYQDISTPSVDEVLVQILQTLADEEKGPALHKAFMDEKPPEDEQLAELLLLFQKALVSPAAVVQLTRAFDDYLPSVGSAFLEMRSEAMRREYPKGPPGGGNPYLGWDTSPQ